MSHAQMHARTLTHTGSPSHAMHMPTHARARTRTHAHHRARRAGGGGVCGLASRSSPGSFRRARARERAQSSLLGASFVCWAVGLHLCGPAVTVIMEYIEVAPIAAVARVISK